VQCAPHAGLSHAHGRVAHRTEPRKGAWADTA
jgi:hypothetical protein